MSGPDISEDTHDVTLKEERVVVGKETVPRERVSRQGDVVVRKEHIEVEGDGTPRRRS